MRFIPQIRQSAFTLLEILVSSAVLMIIVLVSYSILNSITTAWKAQKARLSTFEAARVGFETLANRLSQATLNTYWDYDDPKNPQKYLRASELQFIAGQATELLPDGFDTGTQAVFFVAPFGFTAAPEYQPLVKMLTACGFYIAFSDDTDRPDFLTGDIRIPQRYRYRLYQYYQPGEKLAIYANPSDDWWKQNLKEDSYPVADNVIGLIVRSKYPVSSGTEETYDYDSKPKSKNNYDERSNQLPPTLAITMVVIDEESAKRLENGSSAPVILPPASAFKDIAKYEDDLKSWEAALANHSPKINYRIFSTDVPIRGAKWSSN